MIIVSNHLLNTTDIAFPKDAVIRVNLAWIKSFPEAEKILAESQHDIYLDFPQGRSKPPKPLLTLDNAITLANKYPNVKYFAVSNVEKVGPLWDLKKRLRPEVKLV